MMSKPNVIFIAIDDYRDFASFLDGHPNIITPNLDKLADSATVFSNAHCQAAMCSPSRASLLTGIQPSTSGAYGFQPWRKVDILESADTIPMLFKKNGYTTKGTGKIFHGSPPSQGPREEDWDEYWPSIKNPAIKFHGEVPKGPSELGNLEYGPSNIDDYECGDYQHASWIIDQLNKKHDKPFFLGLGLYRPHLPFVVPKKYFDLYDNIDLSIIVQKEMKDIPNAGLYWVNKKVHEYILKHGLAEDIRKAYMACVSFMDAQVGRVLNALEKSKYADNTIVVFWGDNGFHLGEKQHWRKFTLWKEATRVPLIIKDPRYSTGQTCYRPAGLIDIFPTLVELCELSRPKQELEGHSLVPLLKDPNTEWNIPALTTHGRDSHALTFQEWKYIRYFDGSEELYHLYTDRFEWHNLAKKKNYSNVINNLKKYLPKNSVPNRPGSTLKKFFNYDYPNIKYWEKQNKEWLIELGRNMLEINGFDTDLLLDSLRQKYSSQGEFLIDKAWCRFRIIDPQKPIVITFSNMIDKSLMPSRNINDLKEYKIWGYDYIIKQNLNCISFAPLRGGNWYRSHILHNYLKKLGMELSNYSNIYGYGGSMGGYAVSAFSEILNIDKILLLNPISTLNKALVPRETRFENAQRKLDWSGDFNNGAKSMAEGYIVYDNLFHLDVLQANRYTKLIHLHTSGVGHSTPIHLKNLGMLDWLVKSFLHDGHIDKDIFYKKARKRKKYLRYYNWLLSSENIHLTPKRKDIILNKKCAYFMYILLKYFPKYKNIFDNILIEYKHEILLISYEAKSMNKFINNFAKFLTAIDLNDIALDLTITRKANNRKILI